MQRRPFRFLAIMVLFLFLSGCFREAIFDTQMLDPPPDDNITVVTKDGTRYKFSSGSYKLAADSMGGRVLIGEGIRFKSGNAEYASFNGETPLDSVAKISTSQATPWLLGSIAGIALIVAYIWLGPLPNGRVG